MLDTKQFLPLSEIMLSCQLTETKPKDEYIGYERVEVCSKGKQRILFMEENEWKSIHKEIAFNVI